MANYEHDACSCDFFCVIFNRFFADFIIFSRWHHYTNIPLNSAELLLKIDVRQIHTNPTHKHAKFYQYAQWYNCEIFGPCQKVIRASPIGGSFLSNNTLKALLSVHIIH